MLAIEFQTMIHNGMIKIPDSYSCQWREKPVKVILLAAESPPLAVRRSALEILAQAPGRRLFQNAEAVDNYLGAERNESS